MRQLNSGDMLKIELVSRGESFEFYGRMAQVIPIPETLRASVWEARKSGYVPRMVRITGGAELLVTFEEGTLVKWFGSAGSNE